MQNTKNTSVETLWQIYRPKTGGHIALLYGTEDYVIRATKGYDLAYKTYDQYSSSDLTK